MTDRLFERFCRIIEENVPLDFEHRSLRRGSFRWYRLAGVKLGDGLAVSFTEITARKLFEQQLLEAKERDELADSSKSAFLANARGRAEEALQRQQVELRVLFDVIPAMIWFKDTKDRILRGQSKGRGHRREAREGDRGEDATWWPWCATSPSGSARRRSCAKASASLRASRRI